MDSPDFIRYPDWLGAGLLNGFSWSKSIQSTMPRFLEEYTLHDSNWIGLWSEPGWESVAVIAWDAFWSRGRVPHEAADPILLIQFERLWRQHVSFEDESALLTIADADSRVVSSEEKLSAIAALGASEEKRDISKYLEEATLFHTQVTPIVGGGVELWHAGATRFLCLDAAGNSLPIPDL